MNVLARNNVKVLGSGSRVTVLAHGFGSDQSTWRHHAEQLAADRRVVLFDHVGGGGSDPEAYSPRRYRSLQSYASDLLEILGELDVRDVDYVGHSMGGMIGLLAAQGEASRFRRMVFVGASPRYLNDTGYVGGPAPAPPAALAPPPGATPPPGPGGYASAVVGNADRPELAQEFARTLSAVRPDVALAAARVIFQSDYRSELATHAVPTLVIQASEDIAVPLAVGDYLVAHLPQARLSRVSARGHYPHLSAPGEIAALLTEYLA